MNFVILETCALAQYQNLLSSLGSMLLYTGLILVFPQRYQKYKEGHSYLEVSYLQGGQQGSENQNNSQIEVQKDFQISSYHRKIQKKHPKYTLGHFDLLNGIFMLNLNPYPRRAIPENYLAKFGSFKFFPLLRRDPDLDMVHIST